MLRTQGMKVTAHILYSAKQQINPDKARKRIKQASKEARKQASKEARKQASKQASRIRVNDRKENGKW
ncbi:hypothetical protein M0804_009638 [Polistes exclamans]|nr:hypothetical protein M0804_009638 [Polistes exclamans]